MSIKKLKILMYLISCNFAKFFLSYCMLDLEMRYLTYASMHKSESYVDFEKNVNFLVV